MPLLRHCFFILIFVCLGGCLGIDPKIRPVHFYILSALAKSSGLLPVIEFEGGLGVSQVDLPDYLKTDKLATRLSQEELEYADYQRWAEPLQLALTHTLATNLAHLSGVSPIAVGPWRFASGHHYVLSISLQDATAHADGQVHLSGNWALYEGSHLCLKGECDIQETLHTSSPSDYVAALNLAWAKFSENIVEKLSQDAKWQKGAPPIKAQ